MTAISKLPYQPNNVPLLDVGRDNANVRSDVLAAIEAVYDSSRFLHGPDVKSLEQSVAAQCGTQHAIGCASGSDALLLSLMALDLAPEDEVILPSFTFFATASAVWRLGAKIVFVDIDPNSFNMDVECFEKAITPRTRAVIPVHLFGQCAEMQAISRLAAKHNVAVVEDAAQAIGASHQHRNAGAWGTVGCFSFYPTKNLGACGDAGMITTNDSTLAERIRLLASHGMSPRYYHKLVGINSRIDSMQAAVLNVKLQQLAAWSDQRRANASRYHQLFAEAGLGQTLQLPSSGIQNHHVWNQFTIRVPSRGRDDLRAYLTSVGVGTEIYYPVPLHLQECFQELGYEIGSLPWTERVAHECLSLPIFPGLTEAEQATVVGRIAEYYLGQQASAA